MVGENRKGNCSRGREEPGCGSSGEAKSVRKMITSVLHKTSKLDPDACTVNVVRMTIP
jgi:hypothetical protein